MRLPWSVYSTQGVQIAPFPGSFFKYYVFTLDYNSILEDPFVIPISGNETYYVESNPNNKGLQYTIVDMKGNNCLGKMIAENIPLFSPALAKETIIKHPNNISYWVVTHEVNNNNFRSYFVSQLGVSTSPVISSIGSYQISSRNSTGFFKSSPDGKKIVSTNYYGPLELFDFDSKTGVVTNVIELSI